MMARQQPPRRYRLAGCFHALLSALQSPLGSFVARCISASPHSAEHAKLAKKAAKSPLRVLVTFICDEWETYFDDVLAPATRNDLKLITRTQGQVFYSGHAPEATFERAIDAAARVLDATHANATVVEDAAILKRMLCVDNEDQVESESDEGSGQDTEDRDVNDDALASETESELEPELRACTVSVPVATVLKTYTRFPEVFALSDDKVTDDGRVESGPAAPEELLEVASTFLLWRDYRRVELCCTMAIDQLDRQAEQGNTEALAQQPLLAKCLIQRAQCRLRLHQWHQVLEDADAAMQTDPDLVDAHRLRCNAYIGLCDRDNAIDACDKVLELSPSGAAYQSKLDHLERCEELTQDVAFVLAIPPDLRKSTSTRVDRAMKELDLLKMVNEQLLPIMVDAVSNRMAYEDILTRSIELVEDLASSETPWPRQDVVTLYASRAVCRFVREDWEGADSDARVALSLASGWLTGWRLVCVACMEMKRWQDAMEACDVALELSPESTEFSQHQATIMERCDEGADDDSHGDDPVSDDDAAGRSSVSEHVDVPYCSCSSQDEEGHESIGPDDEASHPLDRREGDQSAVPFNEDPVVPAEDTQDDGTVSSDEGVMHPSIGDGEADEDGTNAWTEPDAETDAVDDAADDVQKVVTAVNDQIKALIHAGVTAYNAKEYTGAEATFTQALVAAVRDDSYEKKSKLFGHRARCRLALNRFTLALEDADAVLGADPGWLEGHRLKCLALMGLKRWREANAECDIVVAGAPKDTVFLPHKKMLEEKLRASTTSTATPACESKPRLSSSYVDSEELRTAKTMIAARNVGNAILWLKKELVRSQTDPQYTPSRRAEIIALRAQCRFGLHQFFLVVRDAMEALAVDKDCIAAHLWLAAAHLKLKQYGDAVMACATGLALDPANEELLRLCQEIHEEHPLPCPATVFALVKTKIMKAHEFLVDKQVEYALDCFVAALVDLHAMDPAVDRPTVVAKLGNLYCHTARCRIDMNLFEGARRDAVAAIKYQSSNLEAHRLLCKALTGLEQWESALEACDVVLRGMPHDVAMQHIRTELKTTLAGHGTSLVDSSSAEAATLSASSLGQSKTLSSTGSVASEPSDQEGGTTVDGERKDDLLKLSRQGIELLKEKQYSKADQLFTEAINLHKTHDPRLSAKEVAGLYICRARCRLKREQYRLAMEDARAGLAANGAWAEANRLLCLSYMGLEKWREALKECDAVLQLVPTDTAFQTHRKTLVAKLPSPPSVASSTTSSVSGDGSTATANRRHWRHEGISCYQAGDYAAGDEWFTRAIDAYKLSVSGDAVVPSKSRAKLYAHRARCRLQLDKHVRALEDAQMVCRLDASSVEGRRIECQALVRLELWTELLDTCHTGLSLDPGDTTLQEYRRVAVERISGTPAQPEEAPAHPSVHAVISMVAASTDAVAHDAASQAFTQDNHSSVPISPVAHITPAIERYAQDGSGIARCYMLAHMRLHEAATSVINRDEAAAFRLLNDACRLWHRLEIPAAITSELRHVGSHDALRWGGPLVYARLHSTAQMLANEKSYWRQRVEQYPADIPVRAEYARALWKANDSNALRKHVLATRTIMDRESKPVRGSPMDRMEIPRWPESTLLFLTAMCAPIEKPSWISSLFSREELPTRREALMEFVETVSVDDEWMPHACYALGVLALKEKDGIRATQLIYLAQEIECRRTQLGLFGAVVESECPEKTSFFDATYGLSIEMQFMALTRGDWRCIVCGAKDIPVTALVAHQLAHEAGWLCR